MVVAQKLQQEHVCDGGGDLNSLKRTRVDLGADSCSSRRLVARGIAAQRQGDLRPCGRGEARCGARRLLSAAFQRRPRRVDSQ